MNWEIFFMGYLTGVGSIGIVMIFLAAIAAIRAQKNKQEFAEKAMGTVQEVIAKAGTAAMMGRDGRNPH